MRHKTFKFAAVLAACAALVCLAGCGSPSSSVNLPPPGAGAPPDVLAPGGVTAPSSSASVSAPQTDSPPAGASQGTSPTSDPDSEIKSFTGVIDSIGMGQYYVRLENEQVIAFPYEGADMSELVGDRPGSPVVVYYTGTLTGTDTSAMTVVKMATPE